MLHDTITQVCATIALGTCETVSPVVATKPLSAEILLRLTSIECFVHEETPQSYISISYETKLIDCLYICNVFLVGKYTYCSNSLQNYDL